GRGWIGNEEGMLTQWRVRISSQYEEKHLAHKVQQC
ncbi:hypothetical protein CCACVL1_11866, partial [Corchorus capsularis]